MRQTPNRPQARNGKWRIRWIDACGARRSETYSSKRDADFALRRHLLEVEETARGLRAVAAEDRAFDALCDEWLAVRTPQRRRQDNDVSFIRSALRPFFGSMKLRELSGPAIERFKAEGTKAGRGHSTINHHLTLLVSMLRFAVELEWIEKAPRVRKYRVALFDSDFRYLRSADEVRRFLGAARDEGDHLALMARRLGEVKAVASGLAVFPLYATAIFTGMRLGELVALRWDDVDLTRKLIVVQRSHDGPTKAGEVRYVPILDALLPILREWRARTTGAIVFPNAAGNMRDRADRVFRETLRRVLDRGGFAKIEVRKKLVPYVTFHCLRHSFASMWMMNGGDLFRLQRVLGHKTAQMTQRYSHLAPDVFAGDHARLDALVPATGEADVIAIKRAQT